MKTYIQSILFKVLLFLAANVVYGSDIFSPPHAPAASSTLVPFLILGPENSVRYQQVYGASDFASISQGGGYITQIAFYDSFLKDRVSAIIPSIEIDLSTTTKSPDGLSAVFGDNVGADNTKVLGPVILNFGAVENPIPIPLSTPFYYNPSAGNLLIDVKEYKAAVYPPFIPDWGLVSVDSPQDTVSLAWSRDVNATSATSIETAGLFTRFTVTQVPEPKAVVLFLAGLTLLALLRWRPKSSAIEDRFFRKTKYK